MTQIHDIMQVGVGMPERERFEQFARDMLGFPVTRSPDGQVTYVRPDQYQHRIAARTAAEPLLRYVGFDIGGPEELAEWATKLTAEGIDWRHGTPEECVERQVAHFIELKDPDGHHLALSYGLEVDKEPVHYTRDLNVLRLRCNARHHTMAFAPCMPGKTPRLQHVMLEVDSLDDVMRSYHFLRIHKAPIGMGPGRHINCQTVHVYVQTPGGFAVEFGWGHRRLDDATHQPVVYPPGSPVDVWGGDIQSSEFELG